MSGRAARLGALLAGVVALGGSTAGAAPITFNTALPVAVSEFVLREQFVLARSGDDAGAADRDREALAGVSVLGYGATSKLALFAVLPYVEKRLELAADDGRRARSGRGIGDLSVFARYTALAWNAPGRSLRLAPFAGLEFPTGRDEVSDDFGRLPAAVQPGSGSFDPFAGLIVTYQTLDFEIDGQLSYRANTRANDFEAGDVARLDGSLQYRVWPRELGGGVPAFLYGVVEANLIHRARDEVGGASDANSGGTTLFLVPGLQYVTTRWVAEAAVQLPAIQNLNGTALESGFVLRAGFRVNF